jgi:hypothetical protein
MPARIFNVLIGAWLFLSAFAWPHTSLARSAALICGGLTAVLSLGTIYVSGLRYLTAVVATALFVISMTSAERFDRTFWHNGVIAVVIFVAALVDRGPEGARHERELHGRRI